MRFPYFRRFVLALIVVAPVVAAFTFQTNVASSEASSIEPESRSTKAVRSIGSGDDVAAAALRSGNVRAKSLATADFDGDGAPDVVAGYSNESGTGLIALHRGNPEAFAPTDDSVFVRMQEGFNPASLLPDPDVYTVPVSPDFLITGNFTHDSEKDVLLAANGGELYLMMGNGAGLDDPQQIDVPGLVTALAAGEFRATDGFTDVAVGVTGPGGESLLIFDAVDGLSNALVQYQLSASASGVEFGGLDDDPFMDIAATTGDEILVIHGWGRKDQVVAASRIERINVGAGLRGLALGEFAWDRKGNSEIAALSDDGTVHVVQNAKQDDRPFSEAEAAQRTRGKLRTKRISQDIESFPSWEPGRAEGWIESRRFTASSLSRVSSTSAKPLLRTNLSYRETDDLLLMGESQPYLEIVRQTAPSDTARGEDYASGELSRTTLDVEGVPVAILPLPQKLNGVRDVVVLNSTSVELDIEPQAANTTITVDRTDDPSGAGLTAASACTGAANDCSLRGALQFANNPANNNTTISLPANTYILSINGTSQGGCDGNTVGDLGANQTMSIVGAGAATTIIRQTGTGPALDGDRIMCMNEPFTVGLVYNFSGVSFVGGREGTAAGTGTALGGAGIIGGELNNSLTMTNVVMANNQETVAGSANLGGGGIQITGGNLIITNSTLGGTNAPGLYTDRANTNTGNSQAGSGGGITYTPSSPQHAGGTGTLTVTGSTFSRNTSTGIGGGGADLLIFAFAAPGGIGSGSASIGTSTFSNNQAANGGGIVVESLPTTVATTNFTSNSASNRGGGIYVGGGSLLLNGTTPSITFTGNTATNAGSSVSTAAPVNVDGTNTTIGGDIEVGQGGTWTNNTGSTLAPTNVVVAGGIFNMNNSTMNVGGNLTIVPGGTNGGSFNGNTGTVNIQGNFVLNAGGVSPATNLNAGTGTFNFNGTGAQSITNGTSITFFNLTDSNITQPLTLNNSINVGGTLNVNGANAILGPIAATVIGGTGTLTGTGTARVTRIAATADFSSQYTITNKTLTNLTVEYMGTAAQILSPITFGPLKINNGNGVNLNGTSTVNGLLTLTTGALGVGNQTLVINNGTSVGAGSITSNPTGTVNYNQGSNGQNVLAFNYGNLTLGDFNKVLAPTGTIGIAGTFTPGSGLHTIAGSTLNFNGTGAQTVPAFNYNNLNISGARGANNVTLVNGGTIGVAGVFNPTATFAGGNYVVTNNTVDFNGSGAQTIPAFNYSNLTSSNVGARTLANAGTIGIGGVFTPGGNPYTIAGSTINFNSAGAQTIPAFNYNNLTSSGVAAPRTLANSGVIGIAGVFTQGVNVYTITGSTIDFNGSGAQTIPAFNYNNLTSSNVGVRTLAGALTIGIAGVFTPGTNVYTITGSTINFNGTVGQTVPAFNYNNLTISGARGVNNVTLANGGTIGVAGTFSPTATFGGGNYVVTNNTVDFNGNGPQTIPVFNFNNLSITGPRGGSIIILTAGTIGIAGAFNPTATSVVYAANANTINFNGTGPQAIPAFNYNNLTSSSAGARTLASIGTIRIASVFTPGTNIYTITGSTVEYNGALAQVLPPSFTTYNNLTLNNLAGVTGFPGLNVLGLLRVQAGTFTSSSNYKNVQIDPGATLVATPGSTINVTGNWVNSGTFTPNTGTVVFNGSAPQNFGGTFNNVTLDNPSGANLNAATTINGNLTLTNGTLNVGSNTLTLNSGVSGTSSILSNANGTVNYNQALNGQNILPGTYGNLTFSNFTKILPNPGTVSIAGVFTTGAAGGHAVTGSTIVFNGASLQTLPAGFTPYNNLTIDNAAGTNLAGSVTVDGVLTLTNGNIDAGANTLTIGTDGNIARTSGHVLGNLQKLFGGTGAFTYHVGTPGEYSPVDVVVSAGTGSLSVKANDGIVPATPPLSLNSLQRYWTLDGTGITADVTFHYLQSDVVGVEAIYRTVRVDGTTATVLPNQAPCPGVGQVCVDPNLNTIFVGGLTSFSNWSATQVNPTAGEVSISGRVTYNGRGLGGVRLTLTDAEGNVMTATTNRVGFYRFENVESGKAYILTPLHRLYRFTPLILVVPDNMEGVDFVAEPR